MSPSPSSSSKTKPTLSKTLTLATTLLNSNKLILTNPPPPCILALAATCEKKGSDLYKKMAKAYKPRPSQKTPYKPTRKDLLDLKTFEKSFTFPGSHGHPNETLLWTGKKHFMWNISPQLKPGCTGGNFFNSISADGSWFQLRENFQPEAKNQRVMDMSSIINVLAAKVADSPVPKDKDATSVPNDPPIFEALGRVRYIQNWIVSNAYFHAVCVVALWEMAKEDEASGKTPPRVTTYKQNTWIGADPVASKRRFEMLLGTPNGKRVAYFLIDYPEKFAGVSLERFLWNPGMKEMWQCLKDGQPPGVKSKSQSQERGTGRGRSRAAAESDDKDKGKQIVRPESEERSRGRSGRRAEARESSQRPASRNPEDGEYTASSQRFEATQG